MPLTKHSVTNDDMERSKLPLDSTPSVANLRAIIGEILDLKT
jgi:hypothetical protein